MRRVMLACVVLVVGCSGAVPRADTLMADAAGVPLATLERGRAIYLSSCTGCHDLYRIDAFDRAAWRKAARDMAPKAKLSVEEHDELLAYLMAAAR